MIFGDILPPYVLLLILEYELKGDKYGYMFYIETQMIQTLVSIQQFRLVRDFERLSIED